MATSMRLMSRKFEGGYIYSQPTVAIASRYPIVEAKPLEVDPILKQQAHFEFNRTPLLATIATPELGKLDCTVVHFKSQRPMEFDVSDIASRHGLQQVERWRSTAQRGMESRYLLHLMAKQMREQGQPQIIMGDFNKDIHSEELKCLLTDEVVRFFDVKDLMAPRLDTATHYYGEHGNILDYILVSEALSSSSALQVIEATNYQVLDQHLVSPDYAKDYMSSDHALISVDLNAIEVG